MIIVFLVMNLFTYIWNPVTVALIHNVALHNAISNIVTTVVTSSVSMVIIFIVDKTIFSLDLGKKKIEQKQFSGCSTWQHPKIRSNNSYFSSHTAIIIRIPS